MNGSFAEGVVGSTVIVPRLRQFVYLNGALRSDVECLEVQVGVGTAGSTASFRVPRLDWDGGKRSFRGMRVRVDVQYVGGGVRTVFSGNVTRVEGSTSGREVLFSALSLMGLSDAVYIGQANLAGGLVARYPARALFGGGLVDTNWNTAGVLRDWLGSSVATWRGGGGSVPSGWRSRLRLGDTSALSSVFADVSLGDLEFRQSTLRDGIDQLLGLVGSVSCRERFVGDVTWLDFFELGDPGAPVREVIVARAGTSTAGSNVISLGHDEDTGDVRTRVLAYGGRKRFVLSLRSDGEALGLQKGWSVALEPTILQNPEAGKRGRGEGEPRPEFAEALSHVFRRYVLPDALRGAEILKDNAVLLSDGRTLPIQVWKIASDLEWNAGTEKWVAGAQGVPELLEGVQLDLENGVIVLRDPAINLVESDSGGDVYQEAIVGITLTVAGERLRHDTGVRGAGVLYGGLDADGLTEVVVNESFGFRQAGDTLWPNTLVLIPGQEWVLYEGPFVFQDDGTALRRFADLALREKNRPRVGYQVTTPFFSSAYRIGDRIRVRGQADADFGTHQVMSVVHNLRNDHGTTIGTDNTVPLVASTVLGGGG